MLSLAAAVLIYGLINSVIRQIEIWHQGLSMTAD